MKIYLLPGLGFDSRIFRNLDLGEHQVFPLEWIEPETGESLQDYARRMSVGMEKGGAGPGVQANEGTVLIGHSLGGIVSQEIARQRQIDRIILISSIRSRAEMPLGFRMIKPLGIHHLFSREMSLKTQRFWAHRHDYDTPETQKMLWDMVSKQSNRYLRWALQALSGWQASGAEKLDAPLPITQIHGARDRTFPAKLLKQPDFLLPEGGHFMVYKHPEAVSQWIQDALEPTAPIAPNRTETS